MESTLEITEEYTNLTISIETAELVEDEELMVKVSPGDPVSEEVEKTPYFIVNEWSKEQVVERIVEMLAGEINKRLV